MFNTDNELHHLCWLSAADASSRASNPVSETAYTQALIIKASNSPVARSRLHSDICSVAGRRALPHRSLSSTPELAVKSP
jgi:hypothetical protein